MTKNGIINARIEEKLKKEAESVFENLNLSATTAIALFYRQCVLHNGLPFELKVPASSNSNNIYHNNIDSDNGFLNESINNNNVNNNVYDSLNNNHNGNHNFNNVRNVNNTNNKSSHNQLHNLSLV